MTVCPKLTDREMKLMQGIVHSGITIVNGQYVRLGGSGTVTVRYDARTLPMLARRGLVYYDHYWRPTALGVDALMRAEIEDQRALGR